MKALVYGAGPLGSLFAARLSQAGHDTALLARGKRLADLQEYGVVLVDENSGERTVIRPRIVTVLKPEDAYDLVLVIMRKNSALQILPVLAANRHTPNVLFLMNNAAGPDALVQALGKERVLMGFPMAAGYRDGHVIHFLANPSPQDPAVIPFGEVDGEVRERTRQVAAWLASMPGFDAEMRTDMDAWLKSHVALLMPSLAPALAGAENDHVRLANTPDLLVLAVRAIREGFRVLRALDIPIVPKKMRIFSWLPEPLLVWILQKRLRHPLMRVTLAEHAGAAQDELIHLTNEFLILARKAAVPTPAIDHLYTYYNPEMERVPEGSTRLKQDWRGVWIALTGLASFFGLIWLFFRKR